MRAGLEGFATVTMLEGEPDESEAGPLVLLEWCVCLSTRLSLIRAAPMAVPEDLVAASLKT